MQQAAAKNPIPILIKMVSVSLIAISGIGTLFFRHYKGSIISYPALWYAGFLAIGLPGVFILYRQLKSEQNKKSSALTDAIKKAKATAQKIELDFDNCQFKNGTYTHEVQDEALTVITHLAPHPFAAFAETTKTETREQTRIVYTQSFAGKEHRFISHAFPFDAKTLQYYVITRKVVLYIDRFDNRKYWFEMITAAR